MKADKIIKNAKIFTSDKDLLAEEHEGCGMKIWNYAL